MAAYYSENDPYAAEWLRNLILFGLIADGDVDTRSIVDVKPDDLRAYDQCHFFAGIGVWSYALRAAGWPDDRPVWSGSCPCQPFSIAGRGDGVADERHLWPHWHHLIYERRPRVIFGEQVASKDGLGWLDLVHTDLEATGYAVGTFDLCAAGVGAPHIRQRLFFAAEWVGDTDDSRLGGLGRGHRAEAGRLGAVRSASETGESRRLDNTDRESAVDSVSAGRQLHGGASDSRRLADDDDDGRGRLAQARVHERRDGACSEESATRDADRAFGDDADRRGEHGRPGPTNGYWRDADWLFCRDGKWRPVEPELKPLVVGAPGRVGRLRAYGNAIVAPLAEEVIRAYMECRPC